MKDTLFNTSLKNHQELIDHILKYKESDGVCRVSQAQLMLDTGRGWTWISKAINKINTEEILIQKIGSNSYRIFYETLLEVGVFARISLMLTDTNVSPEIVYLSDSQLMNRYGCKRKTVQMYRAYVLTGSKTGTCCW